MGANHVEDAIAQVREIHQKIVESGRFKGYSGRARALGGTLALAAAALMSVELVPRTPLAHVVGWGVVCAAAMLLNYGALACWLFSDPEAKRDVRRLIPSIDVLPPIFVGGALTAALILNGHHDYLFGVWMLLYGLANLASRRSLPWEIWPVGLFYLACGAVCLLTPTVRFLAPWPMGIVFFIGEWIGGFVLFFNRNPGASVGEFFYCRRKA